MKLVPSTCCGFDLRTSGLLIGGFGASFHLLNLILAFDWIGVHVNLFFIFVHLSWIYGIITKNSNYLIFGLIFPVVLSLFTFGLVVQKTIPLLTWVAMSYYDSDSIDPELSNIIASLFCIYLVVFIFTVPDMYITMVKYSLYNSIVDSKTDSLSINSIQMETKRPANEKTAIV